MANRRFIDFPIASTVGDSDIILIWQSGVNKQTTKATFLSGLPENLDELNDVAISGLTNGQILRYDSVTGKWENTDQGNLDLNDLNDVSIVSPSNGQVLVYNSSTSKWENSSGGFVPYVGAVTTVDLGAQGLRAGYVRFDTSVASVPDEQGLMYWDASRSTAALIMNGTLQHIGQDTFFYVKNSSGSNIPKGTCVRFAGTDGASGHLLVAPFLANGSVPSSYFMGVTAEAIANGAFGQVMHFGELEGINTSGFTAGALLYASTTVAGGFQTTVPVAPNNIVLVAAAVNSKNNGAIVVRPTYGSNINIDEGVKITSPTTGDLLQLQAGGLWENKTIDGAGIVTKATSQVISGLKTFNVNTLMMQSSGNANAVYLSNSSGSSTYQSGFNFFGFNTDNHIYFAKSSITGGNTGILAWTNTATRTYTLKDASGTLAFTSDIPANPVGGTGTTNYLPKFTGTSTIGDSALQETSGNLGLGVTPSAWSLLTAIQIKGGAFISGYNNNTYVGANWYFDGSVGRYLNNDFATSYIQTDGEHQWLSATSGTAGNAISFTQAMTLTSGGNLLVGTTSDNGARLQVSGEGRFYQPLTNTTSYLTVENNRARNAAIRLKTTVGDFYLGTGIGADVNQFQIFDGTAGANRLTIASTGAATFSSSVTANGAFTTSGDLFLRTTGAVVFNSATNFNTQIYHNAGSLVFYTGANERMYITSTGNVGIGTSSPQAYTNFTTLSVDNPTNGGVVSVRYNGTAYLNLYTAFGEGRVEGANGSFLTFRTTDTERMRITSSGNVGIGTNTFTYSVSGRGYLGISGTTDSIIELQNNGSSAGYLFAPSTNVELVAVGTRFLNFTTNGTERMRITSGGEVLIGNTDNGAYNLQCNGTGVWGAGAYVNGSDRNIKDNIATIEKGLEYIQKMNPVKFRYKPNYTRDHSMQTGFIAQELQEVFASEDYLSGLVQQGVHLSVAYQNLLPVLVKAIQELNQKFDTLKN